MMPTSEWFGIEILIIVDMNYVFIYVRMNLAERIFEAWEGTNVGPLYVLVFI